MEFLLEMAMSKFGSIDCDVNFSSGARAFLKYFLENN